MTGFLAAASRSRSRPSASSVTGLDQLRRVHVGEVGLQFGVAPRLLAGGDDDRHVPGLGVDQVPHRVACARRGVQVHQRRPARGLREAVRQPDRRALLQRQDVAEVIREVTQHWQLVRAGVPEDGGDPVGAQDLVESVPYVHEHVPPCCQLNLVVPSLSPGLVSRHHKNW
jgi:hypothetical protein